MVYRCRAQKPNGLLCKNPVKTPDIRCHLHPGKPAGYVTGRAKPRVRKAAAPRSALQRTPRRAAPARPAPRMSVPPATRRATPTVPSAVERRRLEEVASFCADSLKDGGTAAIADRAAAYVTDETWKLLLKKHRRKDCSDIAELARAILEGKEQLHHAIGRAADGLLGFFGRSRIERTFARELSSRIPLPWDAQLAAAARGLQIAGIYLCFIGNRELTDCACLRDVLTSEGKAKLQGLIQAAVEDWKSLPARMADIGAA
jgi:hypothetical protein